MERRTYHRDLRLKSGTQAPVVEAAESPWLDDQTTTLYALDARFTRADDTQQRQLSQSLQRMAALPSCDALPPSAAELPATEPLVRAPVQQRVDAAVESFWKGQTNKRRAQLRGRAFEPTWLRMLAAAAGIALCATFGWVLVAGPELPSFTPKTKTLAAGLAESESAAEAVNGALAAPAEALPELAAFSGDEMFTPSVAADSGTTPTTNGKRALNAKPKPQRRNKARDLARGESATAQGGRPATLRINSQPASEVFIDDKAVGSTPQLSISLQPGVHNVRLHNRQLNLLKILTLHVLPGETIDRVELLDP